MTIMKALIYHGPGDLRMENRPIPKPGHREVLMKVKAVSICGSDLGAYKTISERFIPPLILGHEFSGDVFAVGEGVTKVKVGQRGSAHPILYCGKCYYCTRGMINLCTNRRNIGTTVGVSKCDGAMAEYICLPEYAVVPLQDSVTYEQGALLEPLAVCVYAAKHGGFKEGETTVVIGAGPIGLMTIKCLETIGAGKIIAVDVVDHRLEAATKLGANEIINAKKEDANAIVKAITNGIGADRVIVASGAVEAFTSSLQMARSGGSIVLVGLIESELAFCPMDILARGLSIYGSYMFTDEIYKARDLLATGKIDISPIITAVKPFDEAVNAFEILTSPSKEIKVIIKM